MLQMVTDGTRPLVAVGPRAQLLLAGPPARLLLTAPQSASPSATTTAVLVIIVKDRTSCTAPTTVYAMLLTGPAPQLLLTGPSPQLLLTGAAPVLLLTFPARLLLEAPSTASQPAAVITKPAVAVFIVNDIIEQPQAGCTTVAAHLPPLTGPSQALQHTGPPPPQRLPLPALPTRAAHGSRSSVTQTRPATRVMARAGRAAVIARPLPLAGPPLRRLIKPHPRLLLQAAPAVTLPPTLNIDFAGPLSLLKDGAKPPAHTTARARPTSTRMSVRVCVMRDSTGRVARNMPRPLQITWPAPSPVHNVPSSAAHPVRPHLYASLCV